jgi:hypothetical protein
LEDLLGGREDSSGGEAVIVGVAVAVAVDMTEVRSTLGKASASSRVLNILFFNCNNDGEASSISKIFVRIISSASTIPFNVPIITKTVSCEVSDVDGRLERTCNIISDTC